MPGRGGGRGPKKNYKGRSRHFTDEETLRENLEKEKREKQWRKQRGEDDEEEEEEAKKEEGGKAEGAIAEGSESESEESSSDDEDKHKGVSHLIAIENPNRVLKKNKKLSELDEVTTGPKLTRREREELEKQQAKERYAKLHAEGKTEEARSDLARLQLIRKQREEAAKKREEERLAKEKAGKKDS